MRCRVAEPMLGEAKDFRITIVAGSATELKEARRSKELAP